jgi:hypothetical protein
MDQAAAALAKSQIDSERALGLFAQSVAAWRRVYDDQASLQAQCASDERCVQRAQIAARRAAEPFVQELARVAGGSRDPRAYALAAYRCASFYVQRSSAGACSVISAESWAQLEPDNLTPWLFVAQSADAANDARARDDALYRASKAKYVNTHWDSVFPLVETSLLARADPATQLVAYGDVLGVYAAFPLAQYQHVVNYCRKDALADGIRRQSCNDLATLLVNRSSTLVDLRVGTAVGERLGWSSERLQALRDESEALQYVSSQALSSSDFHSCEALRRIQARAQALGRHGEIGADRLAAAASGKSNAELARGWRAYVAKVRAESERARKERR